jgi:hypothetical protein
MYCCPPLSSVCSCRLLDVQGYHSRHGQSTQAAGVNGSGSNPQQHEPDAEAASAAQQATTSWPPDDVLSQRVRTLFTLLAQAVVLAETQGLLMPLPGEGLGLSERLLQLPASVDFIEAGASFFHPSLFQEDPEGPLEDLLCADEASGSENSSDEDAAAQQAYAAYSARGRGRGRRGRGRGRSRTSKAERLAAEAAAFGAVIPTAAQPAAAEEEGDEGGFGRRRVQRPNSRYADSILLPVAVQERGSHDGPSGGGASAHHAAPSKEQASEVRQCRGSCPQAIHSTLGLPACMHAWQQFKFTTMCKPLRLKCFRTWPPLPSWQCAFTRFGSWCCNPKSAPIHDQCCPCHMPSSACTRSKGKKHRRELLNRHVYQKCTACCKSLTCTVC